MDYKVSEGNFIGGMEPQPDFTDQLKVTAAEAISKGDLLELRDSFSVGIAADESLVTCGIALQDYASGDDVVVDTEGFVKMVAQAPIAIGVSVISAGAGKVKTSAGTGRICGTAYSTAAADNDVIYVKFSV